MSRLIFPLFLILFPIRQAIAEPPAKHPDRARELEAAFIAVAQEVGPTVVTVSISNKEYARSRVSFSPFLGSPEEAGIGSGVIIDSEGYVLTNEHVISGAEGIQVILSDGRGFVASVIGADPRSDLAVLKLDAIDLPTIRIGDSKNLKIGQWAIALGNPFGIARDAQPSLTVGVISALHRAIPRQKKDEKYYGDLIQTDAAINPGNSGGPLVNIDGKLIGINVLIYSTTGGYQGIGFAIPVNRAMEIADSLRKYRKVEYGWLGVRVEDTAKTPGSPSTFGEGALIKEVLDNTPAADGGLKATDVVVEFGGEKVRTSDDLIRMVNGSPTGKKVLLKVRRDSKMVEVPVTLRRRGESPSLPPRTLSWRGMVIEDAAASIAESQETARERGVLVTRVELGSPADEAGILEQLVITDVLSDNGKTVIPISSIKEFLAVVEKRPEDKVIIRAGQDEFSIRPE